MRTQKSKTFKLVVVGEPSVGKTALVNQFCNHQFNPSYVPTVGAEYAAYTGIHKLQIWEIGGGYSVIRKAYYLGAHGVFLVLDLTSKLSFLNLDPLLAEIREINNNALLFLVGTKADCIEKREITIEQATEFARKNGILYYFETSAKNAINIEKLFLTAADKAVDHKNEEQLSTCSESESTSELQVITPETVHLDLISREREIINKIKNRISQFAWTVDRHLGFGGQAVLDEGGNKHFIPRGIDAMRKAANKYQDKELITEWRNILEKAQRRGTGCFWKRDDSTQAFYTETLQQLQQLLQELTPHQDITPKSLNI